MSVFRMGIPLWAIVVSVVVHGGALTFIDWYRGGLISVVSVPVHLRLVPTAGSLRPYSGSVTEEESHKLQVLAWNRQGQAEKTGASEEAHTPVADPGIQSVPSGVQEKMDPAFSAARNQLPRANSGYAYFNVSDYIPRAYLSAGPEPLSAIEVRPPVDFSGKFAVTIELSLFIDEFGKVRKLRSETPDVAPPFVDAAKLAFEGVAFKPGLLDGKPVRSLIRVAVDFIQD